jgi:tripartite-type tricarboxylate transporter receptor subunit TctC
MDVLLSGKPLRGCALIIGLCTFLSAAPAQAQDAGAFFKGRTITIVVGNSAGGGYDLNARFLARHLGKHIPGNPTIVVQNRPGAGGLNAANYVYNVVPKDGLTLGIIGRIQILEPLFSKQPFDGTKFGWIGSISKDTSTCISRGDSAIKSWDDLMTKEYVAAGQGVGADPDTYALMIKNLFGAHVKLVTGYPGTNDQMLAMSRGEVDGLCGISYSTLKARHANLMATKQIHVLVQNALEREPELPDVPLITQFVKDPETLGIVKLIVGTLSMARPFFTPPAIPEEQKAALRAAFDATMADQEFLADADKLRIDVAPMTGAAIDHLLAELYATPAATVAKTAQTMKATQ